MTGKIIGCIPPSTAKSYYTLTLESGDKENPTTLTSTVQKDAKCSSGTPAPACTSAADAVAKGPTFVYDTIKKDCVDKCAGKKCCLTTDQNGHPGCIGTDTPNVIKMFSCNGDVQTTYSCKNDLCNPTVAPCDPICPNIYTCAIP